MIERVELGGVLYAVIVRREFRQPGVHFVTPGDFSQQLGFISHPAGHRIPPHVHREVRREVRRTQEVLVVRAGSVRVDFYDERGGRVASRTIGAGDAILLVSGGHGFEVLEPCELFEIKQGPYMGDQDKQLLPGASE